MKTSKRLTINFLFAALAVIFSLQVKAQAVCVAVIDSGRNEICLSAASVTFSRAVASGENVQWLSSGDGTFNNPKLQNPTYTPGSADIAAGYVFIYLDVYKDDPVDYCSELPVITLNLGTMNAKATPATQSICTGSSITTIQLSGSISGTTYSWTRDNTTSVTGIAASGTGNVTGTLTNTTGAPITVTFTITPTSATCTGTPITAKVVVSPRPNAVASISSQTICSKSNITPITLSGNITGTTFNWTRNSTSSATGIASSGTGNITGALTNTSSFSSPTVTFTITPSLSGCNGTAITSTVTVSTSAVAATATPSSQTICSGSNITTIIPGGGTSGTSYTWTRNNTTAVTGIAANGSGNIAGALTNTGSAPQYVTFTITPSSGSCTNRATVIVNPAPVATATPLAQTICSGAAITPVFLSGSMSGTVFNWTRDNAGSVTGIATSGSGDISGSLVNTTNAPVTVTFTIIPTANGCSGSPITATIVVNPTPVATATPSSQSICSGTTIASINLSASVNGTTFDWTRDNANNVTGIAANGSGNISGSLTNVSNLPASTSFTITPAANGCQGTPVTAAVVVNPRSTAIISGTQTVCSSNVNISVALTGTAPWNFTYTDGTTPVTINTSVTPYMISVPAVSKTYTITSVSDANCTAQAADITGSAVITQSIYTITASVGANGAITPNGATNINCGGNQSYTITANAGFKIQNVLVDGVSQGAVSTYNFSNVTAPHAISATFTQAAFIITSTAGSNGSITPSGSTTVNTGANQVYSIAANTGYAIQDVLVDGISQGAISTYTFTNVTAAHSISASFKAVSTCTAPTLSTAVTNVLCANSATGAIDLTASGGTIPYTYAWTGPNGFTASTEDISGLAAGTYTVVVTATGGCTSTSTATITQPTAALTATAATGTPACNATSTTLTVTAAGGTGTRQFSLNGGAFQSSSSFAITTGTPYTVTVRDANGCTVTTNTVTAVQVSTVPGTPTGIDGQTSGLCGGGNFTYTVQPVPGATSYFWSLPTGATAVSGQGTAQIVIAFPSTATGTPGIWATPKNGCGSGTGLRITLNTAVTYAASSLTGPSTVTSGQTGVQYSLPFAEGASYNWLVPTGATITAGQGTNSITVNFGTSGGNVSAAVTNACGTGARTSKTVTIGTSTFVITSTAGSNGSITPSGSTTVNTGANQVYSIAANTGYAIQDVLVDGISQGAISTYTFTNVTAAHSISASFKAVSTCTAPTLSTAVTNVLCANSATGAIDLTASGGTIPYTYAWTGPNGFTASTEDISGLAAGTYTVVVTATGGCTSTSTATITQPTAALTATAATGTPACNATSTTLTVTAAGGTGTRQFSLNGGAFQSSSSFAITTGTPYTVTVRDANGCTVTTNTVTAVQVSTVPGTPTGIDGQTSGLCGGGNFTYTVQPVPGATSYFWSLPTGATAVSGQGTAQIVIAFPSTATGTPGIWATPKNGCGSGTGLRITLNTAVTYAASSLTGPSTVTSGQTGVQYSLPFAEGASYNWLVPTGATITAGQGTNSITVNFGTSGGNVSAAVTNACGTGARTTKAVTIAAPRPVTAQSKTNPSLIKAEVEVKPNFSLYPNPAQNDATVVFNSLKAGNKFEVVITNSLGKAILSKSGMTNAGRNSIQFTLDNIPNGIYLVRLKEENTIQIQKLLKNK